MATKAASTKTPKKPRAKSVRKAAPPVEAGAAIDAAETAVAAPPEYSGASTALTDVTVAMEEAAAELPDEALEFLVRSAPAREVWQWLGDGKRTQLLQRITRGFQRTANTLRQSVVRTRLIHHLRESPDDLQVFLRLWSDTPPQPHVVTDVREYSEDEKLIENLPDLWQSHGTEPLLLALLRDNRQQVIEAWEALVDDTPEILEAASEGATEDAVTQSEADQTELRIAALETEAESLRAQLATWQGRAQSWQKKAEAAESALAATGEQNKKTSETLKRQVKQESRRAETAEAQLQETKRVFDRTSRRLKSAEKELEEASLETKRLKRQMRRQQQLNEEIRKQLANVTARLDALTVETTAAIEEKPEARTKTETKVAAGTKRPAVAPSPRPASPLDQMFIWQSEGRQFKLTPREVQRAIDRNDEEFVFTLIQSLDAMRETNPEGFRLLVARIREIGRYYSRVLTADTTRVLVDASNVARFEKDRYGKGQLRHLLAMRDELRRRDCFPILIYADASLPYNIDEPEELLKMEKNGEVQMTVSGQEADELLAREARRTGAYVVTNDRGFHLKVAPDFEPPRVSFRIYDGMLIVDDF